MTRVPPCPRCGELDLVSRDGGCGRCGWYDRSNERPLWWWPLVIGVTVFVVVLLALAIFDPH